MKTKLRLNIQAKFWKDGKLINTACRRIKDRILILAQKENWDTAYLSVCYDNKRDYSNRGYYFKLKDFKEALSAFTESSLIKFILGGKNEQ